MVGLQHIDSVIDFAGSQPFDPDDGRLKIYSQNQAVVVTLDIKRDLLTMLAVTYAGPPKQTASV
jgi:hypothetical protein